MDNGSFRKYGHAFVDWMADYLDKADQYPVKALVEPGSIYKQLPGQAPMEGEDMEGIFNDFR